MLGPFPMLVRNLRGWAEAVAIARRLRPDLTDEAFERAGADFVDWTYWDAPWYTVHPSTAIEFAEAAARKLT